MWQVIFIRQVAFCCLIVNPAQRSRGLKKSKEKLVFWSLSAVLKIYSFINSGRVNSQRQERLWTNPVSSTP
jgi:hypothetical protein